LKYSRDSWATVGIKTGPLPINLVLGASTDRIKFVTYATGWMKWLATEIAYRDRNYRVLPLNVSELYASFSNVSSPRTASVV